MLVLNGVLDTAPADDFLNLEAVTMFKQTSSQHQGISAKKYLWNNGKRTSTDLKLGRDTLDRHGSILAHSRDKFSERKANYFRENNMEYFPNAWRWWLASEIRSVVKLPFMFHLIIFSRAPN